MCIIKQHMVFSVLFPITSVFFYSGEDLVALTTEDEDVDQAHTYDLVNDPSGLFSIKNGVLSASRSFDFETEEFTEFVIVVKSTDDGTNGQPLSVSTAS